MPAMRVSINFEGDDDRGMVIHTPMAFPAQESGVYWFEVAVNGHTQTQVPLRVLYQSVGGVQPPSQAS